MSKNIIFFDIDGTILSHRTLEISESTKAAISQAQANGHLVFINTGRTLAELDFDMFDLAFDGYVCGCGTYILVGDQVLLQETIPSGITKLLIEDLRKYKIDGLLEGQTSVYYDTDMRHPVVKKLFKEHTKSNFKVSTWDDDQISIDKFCIWIDSESDFTSFYEKYKNTFQFIQRSEHFFEIVPIGHSKGTGIQYLLNYYGIPKENTYALGDSTNDLTMLHSVKHSIAMGNAKTEVKEMVSFVTKDVDEDGVYHALKHFGLI
ncbi:MAG TPA: HAD family hydrolase [Clostridiales bacterium]|jgi:Cof subfamily protein (haloacid dehalogenase superfamily)|nr:HAD family hydrolase [Clostridiales bacterium]